jgi:hypothetical protein
MRHAMNVRCDMYRTTKVDCARAHADASARARMLRYDLIDCVRVYVGLKCSLSRVLSMSP